MAYYRPVAMSDPHRPKAALPLAGGWCWFSHVERMERGRTGELVPVAEVPDDVLSRLTAPRAPIAGLDLSTPRVMSILNVTPDSFSDGGLFNAPEAALAKARAMVANGADIIDIGGESTRPGAVTVDVGEEIERTAPVIAAMRAGRDVAISIDTRKAAVAQAALDAGASLVNDVAAFTFDPDMARVTAKARVPCCLMHAQGDPATMQDDPTYVDVTLDVYDFLNARIQAAEAAGIRRDQIVIDPGIGFGKTQEHNLTLLKNLSIFHGLGCAILLGASRKRFIGTIGQAPDAIDRLGGSVAIALHGLSQGVQLLRVHDTLPTKQAIRLYMAVK